MILGNKRRIYGIHREEELKYIMSMLLKYVEENVAEVDELPMLPLFHSCEGYVGNQILVKKKLLINRCKTFDEDLLYFFYGKPSYPISYNESRTDSLYCPISFVINPQKVNIYKIFPFDTGAFKRKLYEGFIPDKIEMDNYELGNTIESVLQYISVMFDNNDNYINGICNKKDDKSYEINVLLKLLNATGSFEFDERSNTVEIISNMNLELKGAIECIILPENLLRVDEIAAFVEESRVQVKKYKVRRLTAPDRYNEIVFQLAMEYLQEGKNSGDV